jgi:hypothetical protein
MSAIEYVEHAPDMRDRFNLRNGQFFGSYEYKNLWWEINGQFFGFGDLNEADIYRIRLALQEDEIFQGWNEHHLSEWQQTDVPMIRITRECVKYHGELLSEKKKR